MFHVQMHTLSVRAQAAPENVVPKSKAMTTCLFREAHIFDPVGYQGWCHGFFSYRNRRIRDTGEVTARLKNSSSYGVVAWINMC